MTAKIIHVCGTMGSGKTTLIRAFMAQHPFKPVMGEKSRPVAYVCAERSMWVMGPYEEDLQTSGCDANKDTVWNYNELRQRWLQGFHVIYEGLFMMNHTRGLELWNATRAVQVIRLTTSKEDCLAGIVSRRQAQGNFEPMRPNFNKNFEGGLVRAENYTFKMRQAGCPTYRVSRTEAMPKMNEVLDLDKYKLDGA